MPVNMTSFRSVTIVALAAALVVGLGAPAHAAGATRGEPPVPEPTAAHAAVSSDYDDGGQVVVLPSAPSFGESMSHQSVAATSPTISPRVRTTHESDRFRCARGVLCAGVWDPRTSDWQVFHISVCATYSLYNWEGEGFYYDNQTGNVVSYFYGKDWQVIARIVPDSTTHRFNWDPIWYINSC